jgi:hypothetical protein
LRRTALTLCIPITLLAVLIAGALRYTIPGVEHDLALRSKSPETLRRIDVQLNSVVNQELLLALDLAANPSTPADALDRVGRHVHGAVRLIAAHHANASRGLLEKLAADCDRRIREQAQSRIAKAAGSAPATTATADCAEDQAPIRALR